jgi:hypothetical protein
MADVLYRSRSNGRITNVLPPGANPMDWEVTQVVPLSDAERLREAAKEAMNLLGNTHRELLARRKLRAALDREGEDG